MHEEQLTFLDLIIIFGKHKKLFWIIFFIIFILGLALIASLPVKYKYIQSIQVAGYLDLGKGKVLNLVDIDDIITKVKNIYIPNATISSKDDEHNDLIRKVDVVKSTTGIFLVATDTRERSNIYRDLFQRIASQIITDTQPIYENVKKSLMSTLQERQRYLGGIAEKRNLTNAENIKVSIPIIIGFDIFEGTMFNKAALDTLQNSHFSSSFMVYKESLAVSRVALIVLTLFISFICALIVVIFINIIERLRAVKSKD